jgi:hypothetical protein
MNITINAEQQLFVIPCGEGYSCAGFRNVYNWVLQLAHKIVQKKILPAGHCLSPVSFYGDIETGLATLDEYDVVGRIGRSGGVMKIPLLIPDGEIGGSGILDAHIVRIIDVQTRKELYRHPEYHQGKMEIRTTDGETASLGYTHGVWLDGVNHANFQSFGKAAQWVAFMAGECMEQPS